MIQPTTTETAQFMVLLELAKQEDFGAGDITSELLGSGRNVAVNFVARENIVFCGGVFLPAIATLYCPDITTTITCDEGRAVVAGERVASWQGPARALLAAERVALNFVQHLSGIATLTGQYVSEVAGMRAKIYDTRKTTPGWRELEKYAVRAGGGFNHRRGLYDAILIKDNHLAALAQAGESDSISAIGLKLSEARGRLGDDGFIMMEVDSLDQLGVALKLDLDIILLDNMSPKTMARAVDIRNDAGMEGKIDLEASGAITLETVTKAAQSGVERISIGAITHSARAVDIGLDAVD